MLNKINKIFLCIAMMTFSFVYAQDVELGFGTVTDTTAEITMSNTQDVGGFQFDVTGATITGASGGSAGDAGFTVSTGGDTVIGFSLTGDVIPAGSSGVLTNLSGTFPGDACLDWGTGAISDGSGNALDATFGEYDCSYVPECDEDADGDGICDDVDECIGEYDKCDVCNGSRYNEQTLEIKYKEKNISDILNMTVEEALDFFSSHPSIKKKLITLSDVGLGYITLGQSATTLSGGEAQRIKLSKELSKRSTGKTLFILDEPTTGLHFADIELLLNVLKRLKNQGNTVVVIEHNLDVIKTADWIIDLGPEGGADGGKIVSTGTPEHVAQKKTSYTGQFLKKILN